MARSRYPSLTERISLGNIQGPSNIGVRESARTLDVLTNSLNQMSNFFMKRATAEAEQEGIEYGAKNAITEQQIKDGGLTGEELEQQLGNPNTAFGRGMRKSTLSILETELETSARKQISSVITNAVEKELDTDELANDLDAINNEYTKLAMTASPIVGQRINATLNTISSSKYHEYAVTKANQELARHKAKNMALINNQLSDVNSVLTKIVNETPDEKTIENIFTSTIPNLKKNFLNTLSKVAKTKTDYEKFLNTFDENIKAFKTSYVLSNTLQKGNHSALAKAIKNNNFSKVDFRLKKIISSMDNEKKLELFKEINTQAKEIQDAEDNENKRIEAEQPEKLGNLQLDFLRKISPGGDRDIDGAKNILSQILSLDKDEYDKLAPKLVKAEDEGDLNVFDSLKDKSDRGILTAQDITNNASSLNSKQLDTLRDELKTLQSSKMDLALDDLTGFFNTEFPGFDPKIIDNLAKRNQFLKPLAQYKKIKAELGRELEDAQAERKDINLKDLVKKKFEDYKKDVLDKVKEQNIKNANGVYNKLKRIAGSAFPKLDEFEKTDYGEVLQFISENKGKLFGNNKSFTEREYKTFTNNLQKVLAQ